MATVTYYPQATTATNLTAPALTADLMKDKAWKKENGKIIGKWIWWGLAGIGIQRALKQLPESADTKTLKILRVIALPLGLIVVTMLFQFVVNMVIDRTVLVNLLGEDSFFLLTNDSTFVVRTIFEGILYASAAIIGFVARKLYLTELAKVSS